MRALIVDHSAPHGLRLGEAPEPEPSANQALVEVRAVSINFGDLIDNVQNAADGTVPGWEASGVVIEAAADGSGPVPGTPVTTFGWAGGWAEVRAVDTAFLAAVPEESDFGALATVPIAGVSALAALDRIGPTLGRRLMVTGASGGVGRYAVQLGRLGGAQVIAVTGSPAKHGESLLRLGAQEVVASPDEIDGFVDGVVDTVGGAALVQAFQRLRRNGTLIALGHVTDEPETFRPGALTSRPGQDNRSIRTFFMPEATDFATGLHWLARSVVDGVIDPGVAWRGDWAEVHTAVDSLRARRLSGKAVLEVPARP